MSDDSPFRWVLLIGLAILIPVAACHRIKAHTGEKLDRRQEGLFILLTLRPLGFLMMAGLIAHVVHPGSMAWSSLDLAPWIRWFGLGIGLVAGTLLVWTLHNLGGNLTDTVVTRKQHTLVTTGPYRWIRHPSIRQSGSSCSPTLSSPRTGSCSQPEAWCSPSLRSGRGVRKKTLSPASAIVTASMSR